MTRTARRMLVSRFGLVAGVIAGSAIVASPATSERVSSAPEQRRPSESSLWWTPAGSVPMLGGAVAALAAGTPKAALPVFADAVRDPLIGVYARLYKGRAELALNDLDA